jgi:hypothetical protein
MISERAKLANLMPRHDQLLTLRQILAAVRNLVTHAHDTVTKSTMYNSRSNTEMNGPWGVERNAPVCSGGQNGLEAVIEG